MVFAENYFEVRGLLLLIPFTAVAMFVVWMYSVLRRDRGARLTLMRRSTIGAIVVVAIALIFYGVKSWCVRESVFDPSTPTGKLGLSYEYDGFGRNLTGGRLLVDLAVYCIGAFVIYGLWNLYRRLSQLRN